MGIVPLSSGISGYYKEPEFAPAPHVICFFLPEYIHDSLSFKYSNFTGYVLLWLFLNGLFWVNLRS